MGSPLASNTLLHYPVGRAWVDQRGWLWDWHEQIEKVCKLLYSCTDTLSRFHTLKEECSGIFDILVAKSSHPDYSYGVVIRYTRPLYARGLFYQCYYQAIVDELVQVAQAMLIFDVGGERDQSAYLNETEYGLAE